MFLSWLLCESHMDDISQNIMNGKKLLKLYLDLVKTQQQNYKYINQNTVSNILLWKE